MPADAPTDQQASPHASGSRCPRRTHTAAAAAASDDNAAPAQPDPDTRVDLKVPITIAFETTEDVIDARAMLNLASGEIEALAFDDYDDAIEGLPWRRKDYEFAAGTLTSHGRDVEFKVDVNGAGQLSISASELLELKTRAAALFAGKPRGA